MRRVFIAMSIMFALSWPLNASGDRRFDTIGSLRSACVGFIDGTGLYLPKGICAGWIIGERELRSPACTAKRENWGGAFISMIARDMSDQSVLTLSQAFVSWANEHPHLWSEKLRALAYLDVWSEFPCDKID